MNVSDLTVEQLENVIGKVIDKKDLATKKDIKRIEKKFDDLFDFFGKKK